MYELALFAGAGGGILGGHLLGWRTICAVERDLYAASILAQRQNDGHLDPFPIWSDVCSFDGRPWRGRVDVISGGFPCQDISSAGRGEGITGARSGLWSEMVRIIREVGPRFVFVENSPMLTSRGLGVVLGDMAALGFNAEWCVLGARDIGAPHKRDRIWILGYSNQDGQSTGALNDETSRMSKTLAYSGQRRHRPKKEQICSGWDRPEHGCPDMAHTYKTQRQGMRSPERIQQEHSNAHSASAAMEDTHQAGLYSHQTQKGDTISSNKSRSEDCIRGPESWWETEPQVGRVAYGVAHGVDRLRALGNGQVPAVARLAFLTLYNRLMTNR